MSKLFSIVFGAIAAVILIIIAALIAIPFVVTPDVLRNQAEKALTASTGHIIKIAGPVDFHVFPDLALTFEDFTMSEAIQSATGTTPTAAATPIVSIAKGTANLKLMPLLSGTAEFDNVTMTGLTVHPVKNTHAQKAIAMTCNVAAKGNAHYDIAQGFTPDAIKRGIVSTTQLDITDIVLLDKQLIATLATTFVGKHVEQFKSLSATITTKDGVVNSDNIALVGTDINATGTATANLITNALNAVFNVKVTDFGTIPVTVKGTMQAPIYTVENKAAVNILMQGLGQLGIVPNKETIPAAKSDTLDPKKAIEGLGNLLNGIMK